MIYTSYFGNLKNIPKNIIPITICAGVPKFWKGLTYKKLAPSFDILMNWKKDKNNDKYVKNYIEKVLSKLNPNKVISELKELAQSEDIVLLCYETSGCFCHRNLVMEWLNLNNIKCEEWNNK